MWDEEATSSSDEVLIELYRRDTPMRSDSNSAIEVLGSSSSSDIIRQLPIVISKSPNSRPQNDAIELDLTYRESDEMIAGMRKFQNVTTCSDSDNYSSYGRHLPSNANADMPSLFTSSNESETAISYNHRNDIEAVKQRMQFLHLASSTSVYNAPGVANQNDHLEAAPGHTNIDDQEFTFRPETKGKLLVEPCANDNSKAHSCNDSMNADSMSSTSSDQIEDFELNLSKTSGSTSSGFADSNRGKDNLSDIIPCLDIGSASNPSTGRTFSIKKTVKASTAFQTWLENKKKREAEEKARHAKMQEELNEKNAKRIELSQQKVQQWFNCKKSLPKPKQNQNVLTMSKGFATNEEKQRAYEKWEQKKMLEAKSKALKIAEEKQRREFEAQQRRQMADEAFDAWMESASRKPKPVPLNMGLYSLRGTCSKQFINPNEWQDVMPKAKKD